MIEHPGGAASGIIRPETDDRHLRLRSHLIAKPGAAVTLMGWDSVTVERPSVSGGAILGEMGSVVDVRDCRFFGCTVERPIGISGSPAKGGALCLYGHGTVAGSTFIRCRAEGGGRGGAVYVASPHVTVDACTFERCQANAGGAVATEFTFAVTSCHFEKNAARYPNAGGAFYLLAQQRAITLDARSCTFIENIAPLAGEWTQRAWGHEGVGEVLLPEGDDPMSITLNHGDALYVLVGHDSETGRSIPFRGVYADAGLARDEAARLNGADFAAFREMLGVDGIGMQLVKFKDH